MTHRFTQEAPQKRQKRQTFDEYDYDPTNYDHIYDEDIEDNNSPDFVEPGEDPSPVAALAEGPLPELVTLDMELKYDRSLLNFFNGDRDKVVDLISRAAELAKPYLRLPSLGVMVDLNFVGEIEFLEDTVKASEEDIKNLAKKFENQDRLISIFATELILGEKPSREAKKTKGIAFTGTACRANGEALSITELAYLTKTGEPLLFTMSKTFAHETGHNLGLRHDHDAEHGGRRGPCNRKGLMSYNPRPEAWSSCSRSDFEEWYRNTGYVCLEAKEVPKESTPAGPSFGPPIGPDTFINCSNKLTTQDSPSKGKIFEENLMILDHLKHFQAKLVISHSCTTTRRHLGAYRGQQADRSATPRGSPRQR